MFCRVCYNIVFLNQTTQSSQMFEVKTKSLVSSRIRMQVLTSELDIVALEIVLNDLSWMFLEGQNSSFKIVCVYQKTGFEQFFARIHFDVLVYPVSNPNYHLFLLIKLFLEFVQKHSKTVLYAQFFLIIKF